MRVAFSLTTPSPRLDNWARHLLVAMVFCVPITTAGTNLFKFSMLACWLAAGGFGERWRVLRANPFAWGAVALYAVIVVSSAWSPAPMEAILFQWSKYNKLLFVLPAITLLQEPKWRDRTMNAFLVAMGITLAASLFHTVWQFPWAAATKDGATDNHFIFKNHIEQNIMMSFFALASAYGAVHAQTRVRSAVWGVLAVAAITDILFLVNGRTGYFTLVACLTVMALVAVPGRWRWTATLSVVALTASAFLTSSNLQGRVEHAMQEFQTRDVNGLYTSSGQRLGFWRNSVELISEKPLLGWGTGAYGRAFCGIAQSQEWCRIGAQSHPHNQTLYLGVESGLPGMLALWVFQLLPLWMARAYPLREKTFIIGLTATLWIDGLFNVPLYAITEAYFFLMLLSALLADYPARARQARNAAQQAGEVPGYRHEQA